MRTTWTSVFKPVCIHLVNLGIDPPQGHLLFSFSIYSSITLKYTLYCIIWTLYFFSSYLMASPMFLFSFTEVSIHVTKPLALLNLSMLSADTTRWARSHCRDTGRQSERQWGGREGEWFRILHDLLRLEWGTGFVLGSLRIRCVAFRVARDMIDMK